MSRRYRLEQERSKIEEHEVEVEEDKIKLQRERIFAPVIWQRFGTGYRIEDLKEARYDETLNMIRNYYIEEEVLFRNAEMAKDEASIESFLEHLMFNMKDNTSLAIINESNEELAGALITKVVYKMDFGRVFSRAMLIEGEAYKKCVNFRNHINRKVDLFVEFDCDRYLRYYALCVKPEYRRKGLGFNLMICGLDLARSCDIPVVMGLFPNYKLQKLGQRIGMRIVHEINYVQWRDPNGVLIFDDPGAGNYTLAIMAGTVPPAPPPQPPEPFFENTPEVSPQMTRKERRSMWKKSNK